MLEILTILLVTQFLAMMSPGPDMILILKNTLGQPNRNLVIFTILGIALGLSIHISLSIAGLAIILIQSDTLFRAVRYAGAAYLAYIGISSFFSSALKNSYDFKGGGNSKTFRVAFREGLLTNLLNPKVTLYIISLFTQFIAPETPLSMKSTYGVFLVLEAIVVWWLFARAINLGVIREWLASYSYWMDRLFGLILIGIAGYVFLIG